MARVVPTLLLSVIALVATSSASAEPDVTPLESRVTVVGAYEYLVDTKDALDLDAAREADGWVKGDERPLAGKRVSAPVWMRYAVRNDMEEEETFLIADLYDVLTQRIDWYVFYESGRVVHKASGAGVPYAERTVRERFYATRVTIAPGETLRVYERIRSTQPLTMDRVIQAESDLRAIGTRYDLILGGYVGLVGVIGLVSTLFAGALRSRRFAYYAALCGSLVLVTAAEWGMLPILLPHAPLEGVDRIAHAAALLMSMAAAAFTRAALDLDKTARALDRALLAVIAVLGALIVLLYVPAARTRIEDAGRLLMNVTFLVNILAAVFAWTKRVRNAPVVAAAWALYFLPVTLWTLTSYGYLPRALAIDTAVPLGQVLQVLLLAALMAREVASINRERALAVYQASRNVRFKTLSRVLTHDMANHVTTTLTLAEMAERQCQDERLRMLLDRIRGSARAQGDIINQVRQVLTSEDGALHAKVTPVAVRDLVQDLETAYAAMLEAKAMRLEVAVEAPEATVLCDRTALVHQVLGNLLSNAIKFSGRGDAIRLRIHPAKARRRTWIVFELVDQGVGMAQSVLSVVLGDEAPHSRPGTEGERGSGWGILITQAYVRSFGGFLEIESRAEGAARGTTARVYLTPSERAPRPT